MIGCILVENISDETADLALGNVIEFSSPFEVTSYDDGVLTFGHIRIETGDSDDEYDDDEG